MDNLGDLMAVTREATSDFNLDTGAGNARGIDFGDSHWWYADANDRLIRAHTEDGTRASTRDISLTVGNQNVEGLTFLDGYTFTLDAQDRRVYAYNVTTKQRAVSEEFTTSLGGSTQDGIFAYNNKFYIIDRSSRVVNVYARNGAIITAERFTLPAAISFGRGLAIAFGLLYIVDSSEDKVFAVTLDGTRVESADFDLDAENQLALGMTFRLNKFWVVDRSDKKVYVYALNIVEVEREFTGAWSIISDMVLVEREFTGAWAINSRDDDTPIPYLESVIQLDQTCTGIASTGRDLLILKNTVIERHTIEGVSVSPNYNYNSLNTGRNGAYHIGGILYVVDRGLSRIYKYDLEAGTHTFLSISGIQASGIVVHNSKIHLTNINGSIRTLNALGQTESNTTLHEDNTRPQGITRHEGKYFIPDSNGTCYAYNDDFSPYAAGNFDLRIGEDDTVGGIAAIGGVFFVLINDEVRPYGPVTQQTEKTGAWSITESVDNEFTGAWSTIERVEREFTGAWSTIKRIEQEFTGAWDILKSIEREFTGAWSISEPSIEVTRSATDDIGLSGITNIQGLGSKAGMLYVLSFSARFVFAYHTSGLRSDADGWTLQTGNSSPYGMAFGKEANKWFVLNESGEGTRIYRYNADGGADGDLGIIDISPMNARGITVENNKIYLVDIASGLKRIHRLSINGAVEATATLDYISDPRPLGLGHYKGNLFIADNIDRIYGMHTDFTRYEGGDFPLDAANQSPSGFTETNNTFYSVDRDDSKIYAYAITASIVERTFTGAWSIIKRVESEHVGAWSITKSVEREFSGAWSIRKRIEREFSGAWSILKRVEREFTGAWSLGGIISREFTGAWSTVKRVEREFTGAWSIRKSIEREFQGVWSIIKRVEREFTGAWGIGGELEPINFSRLPYFELPYNWEPETVIFYKIKAEDIR